MAFLYLSEPSRGEIWRGAFARDLPDLPFFANTDEVLDPSTVRYLAAWVPPANLSSAYANLELVFSVGAGVDQFDLSRLPPQVQVVRMLEPGIEAMMVEYATMAVLALHRNLPTYLAQQRAGVWRSHRPTPATQRRVGVMGVGRLGQGVLRALRPFQFPLAGWSRERRSVDDVVCFAGKDELPAFLERTDILVCLLPLTAETTGLLNKATFARLPKGAALVHMGRGAQLDDGALVEALDTGQLSAAVVDVMSPEPPPEGHAIWQDPRIILTPHIAAATDAVAGARFVLETVKNHRAGLPIEGVVDRTRGY
ncbi:MAG: glyoxylate/hydroxypyruvate reductase A [Pseudomonadota bacterium]